MIASYVAIFTNPLVMEGEKIRIGREHAMLQMHDEASGELTFLVKGKYLIQLEAVRLKNKQALIDLIKAWDVKTIRALVMD